MTPALGNDGKLPNFTRESPVAELLDVTNATKDTVVLGETVVFVALSGDAGSAAAAERNIGPRQPEKFIFQRKTQHDILGKAFFGTASKDVAEE